MGRRKLESGGEFLHPVRPRVGGPMTLPGQVESASPSVPGFDSDSIIVAEIARQFFTAGYKFCLRYISLHQEAPEDLSSQEASDILNSGLALMPIQHIRRR